MSSRARAIKLNCLECAGGSPREVTLCHLIDCPLWPFRFGYSIKDRRFEKRMLCARRRYPDECGKICEMIRDYQENMPKSPEFEQFITLFETNTAPDKQGNSSEEEELEIEKILGIFRKK